MNGIVNMLKNVIKNKFIVAAEKNIYKTKLKLLGDIAVKKTKFN